MPVRNLQRNVRRTQPAQNPQVRFKYSVLLCFRINSYTESFMIVYVSMHNRDKTDKMETPTKQQMNLNLNRAITQCNHEKVISKLAAGADANEAAHEEYISSLVHACDNAASCGFDVPCFCVSV